jgi:hypothetical protein
MVSGRGRAHAVAMDAELHRTYPDHSEQGDEDRDIHGRDRGAKQERTDPISSKHNRRRRKVERENVGHLIWVQVDWARSRRRSKPESTWFREGDAKQRRSCRAVEIAEE